MRFGDSSLTVVFVLAFGLSTSNVNADVLFESGALGPTGLAQGSVAATNITPNVFTGVRFQLTRPVVTEQVGGHFVDMANGTFFGAILLLEDENDFPNSEDLSTPDVLGSTLLTFPAPSAEVFGNVSLSLDPGWYALVFGTGLFGSVGDGAAPRNNVDIGDPSYIGLGPNLGWVNLDTLAIPFDNHRFVVTGAPVPEPCSMGMLVLAMVVVVARRAGKAQRRLQV